MKREDKVLYMTAPSWMMWNWLMAVFGVGATVVLFDGNPGYPDMGTMWRLVDEEQITFFGTSATYINLLEVSELQAQRPLQPLDSSSRSARPARPCPPKGSSTSMTPSRKMSISTPWREAPTSTAVSAWARQSSPSTRDSFRARSGDEGEGIR